MSHALQRDTAPCAPGYKEEPAPVADDLVSASLPAARHRPQPAQLSLARARLASASLLCALACMHPPSPAPALHT